MGGMRTVSENSEADLARKAAMAKVGWALRDLTANLIRVTRGAGRPWEIGRQAQALVEACAEYRDAVGPLPSRELSNALTAEKDREFVEGMSGDHFARYHAEQSIILGALQIVASRLVGQNTQEVAGDHQMFMGLNQLEKISKATKRVGSDGQARHNGHC